MCCVFSAVDELSGPQALEAASAAAPQQAIQHLRNRPGARMIDDKAIMAAVFVRCPR
jgi:hypothetical protein